MIRVPSHRTPTHPGEMLLEEFLTPMGLTKQKLAAAIHVPELQIHNLIQGQEGISPSLALRLARVFNMSASFWMNLQLRWDLYQAQQAEGEELNAIQPFILDK